MLDRVKNGGTAPLPSDDWRNHGMRWVAEPRRHAPGLDSLLSWAYRLGASRIAFQTGHSPTIRVHGRNRRVGDYPLDEAEIAQIVNHLYGADGSARLQGAGEFDVSYEIAVSRTERLRFRLNATATRTSRREGANIVLRPIPDMPPSLEAQLVEPAIMEACRPREGMVIVSGATGSGKSTLIAGMTVAKLHDPEGHYNIVEGAAPIEFLLDRVKSPWSTMNQTEIPRDLSTFEAFRVPFASTEPGMINTPFTPMLESAIEGTPGPSNEAGRPANPIDATLVAGVTAVETAIGASKQTARAKALDLLARRDEALRSLEKSKPPELSADELRQEIHRLINELTPGADIERAAPMATQSIGMAP